MRHSEMVFVFSRDVLIENAQIIQTIGNKDMILESACMFTSRSKH